MSNVEKQFKKAKKAYIGVEEKAWDKYVYRLDEIERLSRWCIEEYFGLSMFDLWT